MADEIQVQSVAHVVFEGFTTLDMYGPVQAFASSRVPDGDGGWHRFFNQFTIGDSPAAVKSGEGPSTMADYSFEDAPDFEILLIPGGFGTRAAVSNDALLAKIAAMSAKADVTATVCTGSAVLARTGLLDGRPATSNKVAWDWVLEQGPKSRLETPGPLGRRWRHCDLVGRLCRYRHGPRPDCPAAGRRDRHEFGEVHGIYLESRPRQ